MVVVGVGLRRGIAAEELRAAVDAVLAEAGLTAADVTILATVDRRAGDYAVRELALDLRWRLAAWPAAELARQEVPHPSATVAAAVGTPSVAEAAALRAAGPGSKLIVPKRVFRGVTAAIARGVDPGAMISAAVSGQYRRTDPSEPGRNRDRADRQGPTPSRRPADMAGRTRRVACAGEGRHS